LQRSQSIIQEKERYYRDLLPETKLNEEVAGFLFKYSKTNKTVLVTGGRENRVTATLACHGLTDKFNHIFCRQLSDYENLINKYSNAVYCLNILPQNILVFENEKREINDAIKAGIPPHNIIEIINY
jgi:beta-phosphoglucomutase-like phosphatase (HAD superfamily)